VFNTSNVILKGFTHLVRENFYAFYIPVSLNNVNSVKDKIMLIHVSTLSLKNLHLLYICMDYVLNIKRNFIFNTVNNFIVHLATF
jgi:hypothetical protein